MVRWIGCILALALATSSQGAPFGGSRAGGTRSFQGGGGHSWRGNYQRHGNNWHGRGDGRGHWRGRGDWRHHHRFPFRRDIITNPDVFVDNGWSGFGWPDYYQREPRPLSYIPSPVPYPIVKEVEPLEDAAMAYGVQQSLKSTGFYCGAIDGKAGPATREAITRFQIAHQLPATGLMDLALLRELGIY